MCVTRTEELVNKVCERALLKHYIIMRGFFTFAFLLYVILATTFRQSEKKLSGDCQILFHVGSTWHPITLL